MYLKFLIGALLLSLPFSTVLNAHADEYLLLSDVPSGHTESDIRKLVENHGEVRTINCIDVSYSGRIKKDCYVLMWSTETARKVVQALDGKKYGSRKLFAKEIYPLPCLKDQKMS